MHQENVKYSYYKVIRFTDKKVVQGWWIMGLRWLEASHQQLTNILLIKRAWCDRNEYWFCNSECMKYVVLDFSAAFKGFACKLGTILPFMTFLYCLVQQKFY